eukprot:g920.t1
MMSSQLNGCEKDGDAEAAAAVSLPLSPPQRHCPSRSNSVGCSSCSIETDAIASRGAPTCEKDDGAEVAEADEDTEAGAEGTVAGFKTGAVASRGASARVPPHRCMIRIGAQKWRLTVKAAEAVRSAAAGQARAVAATDLPLHLVQMPPFEDGSSSAVALAAFGDATKDRDVARLKTLAVAEARRMDRERAATGMANDTADAWGTWTLAMVGAAMGVDIWQ